MRPLGAEPFPLPDPDPLLLVMRTQRRMMHDCFRTPGHRGRAASRRGGRKRRDVQSCPRGHASREAAKDTRNQGHPHPARSCAGPSIQGYPGSSSPPCGTAVAAGKGKVGMDWESTLSAEFRLVQAVDALACGNGGREGGTSLFGIAGNCGARRERRARDAGEKRGGRTAVLGLAGDAAAAARLPRPRRRRHEAAGYF